MKEAPRENMISELYAKMEAKREVLNEEARRVYQETGKLTDPVLCELADEFETIADEYQRMLSGDPETWLLEPKEHKE